MLSKVINKIQIWLHCRQKLIQHVCVLSSQISFINFKAFEKCIFLKVSGLIKTQEMSMFTLLFIHMNLHNEDLFSGKFLYGDYVQKIQKIQMRAKRNLQKVLTISWNIIKTCRSIQMTRDVNWMFKPTLKYNNGFCLFIC